MKTEKQEVIEFFQNVPTTAEEKFNKAFGLYRNSQNSLFGQVRFLNASGFSPANLENLLYDLKKAHNISDAEIVKATKKFEEKAAALAKENAENYDNDQNTDTDNLEVIGEVVVTAQTKDEVFEKSPDQVKEYVSLHDQFPFLDEDDCPEELKILVADKRKYYKKYVEAHKSLLSVVPEDGKGLKEMTNEEIFALALPAVENFEANQAIYAELNHYKKEGEILGKHPIFKSRLLKDKVDAFTLAQLTKRESNLKNYINRDASQLEKETDEDKKEKLALKIEEWKMELSLVNTRLGISE